LHDSSAALIPYLMSFEEPFVLISTGTWSISLNPFNESPLTTDELNNDCLNYMQFNGNPVKASRFFIGPAYEDGIKEICSQFGVGKDKLQPISGDLAFTEESTSAATDETGAMLAYNQLMAGLVEKQKSSTDLVLAGTDVKQLFVDGGFSQNEAFMHLLAKAYPSLQVYSAFVPQSTALGAALAIHRDWNSKTLPPQLIRLKHYRA
jgi:hypothetical protein